MKALRHLFAALSLLLCSVAASAQTFEVDGLSYTVLSAEDYTVSVENGNPVIEEVVIPATVTYEGIEYRVTEIKTHGFSAGDSPTSIVIPESVTKIGEFAFYNSHLLESITFSENSQLTSIEECAFFGCQNLQGIEIPASVTYIGPSAFLGCRYGLTSIAIPEGVTEIGNSAFSGCTSLTSVTIPNSVTLIGDYAFSDCTSLSDIPYRFSSQLTEIGDYAFYNCNSLTSIYFHADGPTRIGTSAFEDCSELSAVSIPNVEHINRRAFYNCSSLVDIFVYTTDAALIGDEAFDGTAWYNDQPDGVVYFDNNLYKYKGEMPENTSIEIKEGTKTIAYRAFANCTNLTSVTIPKSVTMILLYAFMDCTNLTSITCEAVTPPTIYISDAFVGVDRSIPLYVPTAAMSAYKEADFWSDFTNIQPYGHTINYVVDGETVHTTYDVREGTSVSHPKPEKRKGYTFHWELNEVINIKDNADAMLYTNAKCTNEKWGDQFTSWNVLFDGNASTFFHSEYSAGVNSEDGLDHYLRVDMGEGKSVSKFTFTYTVRGEIPYMGNYSPKQMVVEGSNEANGEYEEIALLANLPEEGGAVYNSPVMSNGNAYRYIRFRVTETYQNVKVEGHPYFFMAEFGMEKYTIINDNFVMPAKDIVINGVYTARVNLIEDGSIESIYQLGDIDYAEITYVRTFNNTNWQSLYVPFDIDYEVIMEDFDVAYINDVHQFDDDNDGSIDRTQVEAIKMVSGTLDANYPYLIRAKEVGEKTITVEDAVMYATKENSIDCSSVFRNYTFTGSYRTRTAEDLPASEGYYALAGGEWKQLSETAQLGAFRVYLKIDSRVAGEEAAAAISMRVVGDESGEGTTSIENSKADVDNHAAIYDLQGRRVENPTKGVYIVNGVKRVF